MTYVCVGGYGCTIGKRYILPKKNNINARSILTMDTICHNYDVTVRRALVSTMAHDDEE